jgi:hypothetical protein
MSETREKRSGCRRAEPSLVAGWAATRWRTVGGQTAGRSRLHLFAVNCT